MGEAGAYALLGALVIGILAGDARAPASPAIPFVAGAGLVVVAMGLRRGRWRTLVVAAVVLLVGTGASLRAHAALAASPVADATALRLDATIDATIVDDPEGTRFSTRVLVRVDRWRERSGPWRDGGASRTVVAADDDAGPRVAVLDAGDRVRLRGWFRPLEPFDRHLRWRHVSGRFDAHTITRFQPPGSPWMKVANRLRGAVLRGTSSLPPTERALVAGFLLGDTRSLPDEVLETFRAAGLSHLLAVSGANVAFTLGLLGPLLRRSSRGARLVATLSTLLVFGAMTRWEPSVLRACAMAACAVLAAHTGRPARATRVLAVAVGGLLLLDPFLVHSVGFQLSCGASLGIALLAAPIAARLRGPDWFRESMATTAAAQFGVAPVLLPVFGSMPLVALPANLLAVPIAGPLTMWGLVSGVLAGVVGPVAPPVADVLVLPTRLMASAMVGIADLAAHVSLAVDAPLALALVACTALLLVARRGRMLRGDALVVPPR